MVSGVRWPCLKTTSGDAYIEVLCSKLNFSLSIVSLVFPVSRVKDPFDRDLLLALQ